MNYIGCKDGDLNRSIAEHVWANFVLARGAHQIEHLILHLLA